MNKNLTSLEVIGLGIRSEEDAARFYGHMAKLTKNSMVREKFENLAKEEVGHGIVLTKLYQELSQNSEKPARIPGDPQTAEKGVELNVLPDDMEELLNMAIKREQEAQKFYAEAANQASDSSGEKVLRYLVGVEAGHEAMLNKELTSYLADKDWYMGNKSLEFIHVGP